MPETFVLLALCECLRAIVGILIEHPSTVRPVECDYDDDDDYYESLATSARKSQSMLCDVGLPCGLADYD